MKLSTFEGLKKINTDNDLYRLIDEDTLSLYHEILSSMAADIFDVCKKNDVFCQLSGGSILGAVRNHGFIPWDDDIDLNMKSSDFPRFRLAMEKEHGDKYTIHTWDDEDWAQLVVQIRLRNSIYRTIETIDSNDAGFFIDIFLIENIPDNIVLRMVHGISCMGCGFLLSCRHFYERRNVYRNIAVSFPDVRKAFETKISIGKMLAFLKPVYLARFGNWCYHLYKNENSKYVSIPAGRKHYFGEKFFRSDLMENIYVQFGDNVWPIPKGYDAYLHALYGPDYMTPPPPEDREHHMCFELVFPDRK